MTENDNTNKRRMTWKEAALLAREISEEMLEREDISREREAAPQLKIVVMVQYYDGWSGILKVPVTLDLKAALNEFKETRYKNDKFDNLSDEWWEIHDAQTEALRLAGYQGWDFNSQFNEWLCKEKGCEKVDYEVFLVDSWKYED